MKICFLLEKMAAGFRDQHCEYKHHHTPERHLDSIVLNRTTLGKAVPRGARGPVRCLGFWRTQNKEILKMELTVIEFLGYTFLVSFQQQSKS